VESRRGPSEVSGWRALWSSWWNDLGVSHVFHCPSSKHDSHWPASVGDKTVRCSLLREIVIICASWSLWTGLKLGDLQPNRSYDISAVMRQPDGSYSNSTLWFLHCSWHVFISVKSHMLQVKFYLKRNEAKVYMNQERIFTYVKIHRPSWLEQWTYR